MDCEYSINSNGEITYARTCGLRAHPLGGATVGAAEPCGHDEICGLKNPEDMIRLKWSGWALVSRLGRDTQAPVASDLITHGLDPKGRMVQSHLTVAPTSTFGAASTALLYGKDYWMSSFRGDRIIRLVQSEE